MKDDNILKEKSLAFGIRIVRLAKYFIRKTSVAEQPIFTQILKSGTSIGEFGESTDDFKHKLKIALKEANETEYWIEILHSGEYMSDDQYESIIVDCKELIKLLTASINTLNKK